jgi:autotransporter-associated beta strand protein
MHLPRRLLAFTFATALLATIGRAQTLVTWTGATSSNWNDGTNWSPMNIPSGSADTATFNASSGAANVTTTGGGVGTLIFTSDALASTLTVNVNSSFTVQGGGISNASAFTQSLVNNHNLYFINSATAGSGVALTNNHYLSFNGSSNAGAATLTNTSGSSLDFTSSSSAASATITNHGSMSFQFNATAGSATITNNGSLTFQFNAAAGSAAITNNGTIDFYGSATGGSAAITNGASGIIDLTNGPAEQSFGSLAGGGTILVNSGNLTVGSLNTNTIFSGVINDSDSGTNLTKVGTGILALTNSNNYYNTTINGGLIEFSNAGNFGSGYGTITLNGGGLRWATGNTTDVTAWSQLDHTIGASGATFDTNGNNVTFATGLAGDGAFTKAGAGRLILTAANTYTGGTNINAGSLRLATGGALGSGAVTIASGATLWFLNDTTAGAALIANGGNLYFDQTTTASTATITGAGFTGFYDHATAGTATINTTGNIDFQHNSTASSATITTYGRLSFTGNSSAGASTIVNYGNMTLRGDSPASATIANHNILALYSTGGTPTITNDSQLFFLDDASAAGASITNTDPGWIALFSLSATGTSIGALAGSGNVYLGGKNLTIGARNLDTVFSGVISEAGALVKTGTGTLTLSGANTYTGGTTISFGTVKTSHSSALGTGPVAVSAAGATLALNGTTFANSVALTNGGTLFGRGGVGELSASGGGTISPGNSPGLLTAGATTFGPGGNYVWEINDAASPATSAGTRYDLLSITGTLTITATSGSPFAINLTSLLANNTAGNVINFNSSVNSSYTIATASGGIVGFSSDRFYLNTAGFSNSLNGGIWSIGTLGNDLNLTYTTSAIPEPSTYAALFGASALALAAWRRRPRGSSSAKEIRANTQPFNHG